MEVSSLSQWCYKDTSRVFQGCFKGLSRKFQGWSSWSKSSSELLHVNYFQCRKHHFWLLTLWIGLLTFCEKNKGPPCASFEGANPEPMNPHFYSQIQNISKKRMFTKITCKNIEFWLNGVYFCAMMIFFELSVEKLSNIHYSINFWYLHPFFLYVSSKYMNGQIFYSISFTLALISKGWGLN